MFIRFDHRMFVCNALIIDLFGRIVFFIFWVAQYIKKFYQMKVLNEEWELAHIGILLMAIWFGVIIFCMRQTSDQQVINKIEQNATKEIKGK